MAELPSVLSVQASLQRAAESCELAVQDEALLGQALLGLNAQAGSHDVLSACQGLVSMMRHGGSASSRQLQTYTPFLSGDAFADFFVAAGCLLALVILWECVFLRSSLSVCRGENTNLGYLLRQLQEVGGQLAAAMGLESEGASDIKGEEDQKDEVLDLQVDEGSPKKMSQDSIGLFWSDLAAEAQKREAELAKMKSVTEDQRSLCEVGFTRLNFSGKASEGKVEVSLCRKGDTSTGLSVRVRPCETALEDSDCVACNGKDYRMGETLVEFKPSETATAFSVPLEQPTKHQATQYFEMELVEVVKGSATLGGPTLGLDSESHKVRVYIFNDFIFPCNIPEEKRKSKFWIIWYYLKERRLSRGHRWWKTLVGLLYAPIHSVCISAQVQRLALDRVSDPTEGGDKLVELALLGIAQFVSLALLRWGDKVATENRGRTGGTRMVHRQQLFTKLLMMDAEELSGEDAHWWFYVGVNNVDLMAKDVYYQGFVILQSCFGLLLSIAMLSTVHLDPNELGAELVQHAAPALAVLATALLCSFACLRLPRLADLLMQRMLGEAAWVDSLAWLCHAGVPLRSLAPRTHAKLNIRFSAECKYFTAFHVKARDWSNDTLWYTKWLSQLGYILILVLGASALLQSRAAGSDAYTSGDYVFQLKIFKSCGSYLEKIVASLVKMFSASVGLQQFVQLVNMPEKSTLKSDRSHVLRTDGSDEIVFQRDGEGWSSDFLGRDETQPEIAVAESRMVAETFSIPLGSAIRVNGQTERALSNFFFQVSGLKPVRQGWIYRPEGIRIGYVPSVALRIPHTKVIEELREGCCIGEAAAKLALLLDINPRKRMVDLHAGEAQMLAIVLAIFQDPDVLVLNRPCAFLLESQRRKVMALLELWHAAGAAEVLTKLGTALPSGPARRKRTLITSVQDIPLDRMAVPSVYDLDLDSGKLVSALRERTGSMRL